MTENYVEIAVQAFINGEFYEGHAKLYHTPSKPNKRNRDQIQKLFLRFRASMLVPENFPSPEQLEAFLKDPKAITEYERLREKLDSTIVVKECAKSS